MEKLRKKVSGSSIAIVILSVLLVIAFTTIGTFAWFASKDSADKTLNMGGAVVVELTNNAGEKKSGTGNLQFTLPEGYTEGDGLLPGMWIHTDAAAKLAQSTTDAFLRAKITVVASQGKADEAPSPELITKIQDYFFPEISKLANAKGWYQVNNLKETQDPGTADDTYFYYVGSQSLGPEQTKVEQSVNLLEVKCDTETSVPILGGTDKIAENYFKVPTTWTNEVAELEIKFVLEIEAIQSKIIKQDATSEEDWAETIKDAQYAFEEAKDQAAMVVPGP